MATWGRFRTAGCRLRHMLLRAACCVAATSFPRNALRCGASLERYNPRVAGVRGRREGGRTPTGPSDAPLGARPGCGGRCRSRSGERARARQTRRSARTYRICARHRHGADIASRRALFARGGECRFRRYPHRFRQCYRHARGAAAVARIRRFAQDRSVYASAWLRIAMTKEPGQRMRHRPTRTAEARCGLSRVGPLGRHARQAGGRHATWRIPAVSATAPNATRAQNSTRKRRGLDPGGRGSRALLGPG
jgi:hypothetical protein